MDYQVIDKAPMQIMGTAVRTTNENGQAANDIPPHWERFYVENISAFISNQKTGEVLGLYCDYEKDHTKPYTLVTGCEVTVVGDIPEGFVLKQIPSSKYAVFQIPGPFPENLISTWQWIWEGHLNRTYTGDFEVYPLGFNSENSPDMLLYIAIH